MRKVTIRPVLNGWVCKVGCSEVVFDDKAKMLMALGYYIENPEKAEREYQENAVNKGLVGLVEAAAEPSREQAQPARVVCSSDDAACDPGRAR